MMAHAFTHLIGFELDVVDLDAHVGIGFAEDHRCAVDDELLHLVGQDALQWGAVESFARLLEVFCDLGVLNNGKNTTTRSLVTHQNSSQHATSHVRVRPPPDKLP